MIFIIQMYAHLTLFYAPLLYVHVCPKEVVRHYAEALYQKKDFIAGMKAHFVFPYPQRIQRKFDVIYINFATLHMLHLHPAMRWDRRNMGPLYNYRHQLPYILRGLRNYAKDGKVVLMTPPRVCESSYTSAFRDWLEHEEELLATECVPYLASQNLLIKGPQPEANLSDPATALEFCRNYTLTEKGSRRVAEHIREVAQIEQLQVFDFFHWTSRLSCAHAPDGRHYDTDTMRLIMHPLLKELGLPTTPLPVDQDHYEVYADGYKVPLTALETAAMLSSDPMN